MKNSTKTEGLEYRIVNTSQRKEFSCWPVEKEVLAGIESRIPEFDEQKVEEGYYRKLCDIYGDALILVAYHKDTPIGFSASYMNEPEYRYRFDGRVNLDLWIACVVPEHRNTGLMSCMMDLTGWWADDEDKGYKSMTLKTYPRFPDMIRLAEKKG